MWWNVGPHLKRRMARERGESGKREAYSYFQDMTGVEELREVLRRKFGHITRAWRCVFDEDNNGLIDMIEFSKALKKISFVGSLRSLWNNLDVDQSGEISLSELDPEASQALEKFRVRCVFRFGDMETAWNECLDCNKSGAMTLIEMKAACKSLGYTDIVEIEDLFELLRKIPGAYAIGAHDIVFLQKWEDTKQTRTSRSWRLRPNWVNRDPYFNDGTVLAEHSKSVASQRKHLTKETPRGPTPMSSTRPPTTDRPTTTTSTTRSPTTNPPPTMSPLPGCRSTSRRSVDFVAEPSIAYVEDDQDCALDYSDSHQAWMPSSPRSGPPLRHSPLLERQLVVASGERMKSPEIAFDFRRVQTPESLCEDAQPSSARLRGGAAMSRLKQLVDDKQMAYEDIVRFDQNEAWEDFRDFLKSRYGSLPRAFDMMDYSGDGYLSCDEFMSVVSRKENYCRASEARRLFQSAVTKGGGAITWREFGITLEEWRFYLHTKQMQAQESFVNRQMQIKGLREEQALKVHDARLKIPGKKPLEAFGERLPKGWGFPPSYDPPRKKPLADTSKRS